LFLDLSTNSAAKLLSIKKTHCSTRNTKFVHYFCTYKI
jgi:hypothetical protein